MSEENKLEKRPSRSSLRLSRKQKTERVRRERINTALEELKSMVFKDDDKNEKMDKADILEATVSFVRDSRTKEYQENPSFRFGYNQCVSEFVQFLVSIDGLTPDDKAKLLAGMATILCGAKKEDDAATKYFVPKPQRQPLQSMNLNVISSASVSPIHPTTNHDSTTSNAVSYSNRVSLSNVESVANNPCSSLSPYVDTFDVIDTLYNETSGLETSLAKAVCASINVEANEIISENDNIEEMAGSLPPMRSFLGL